MLAKLLNTILRIAEPDEEVPRYPPFAKGLPVIPAIKILESQEELIKKNQTLFRCHRPGISRAGIPLNIQLCAICAFAACV